MVLTVHNFSMHLGKSPELQRYFRETPWEVPLYADDAGSTYGTDIFAPEMKNFVIEWFTRAGKSGARTVTATTKFCVPVELLRKLKELCPQAGVIVSAMGWGDDELIKISPDDHERMFDNCLEAKVDAYAGLHPLIPGAREKTKKLYLSLWKKGLRRVGVQPLYLTQEVYENLPAEAKEWFTPEDIGQVILRNDGTLDDLREIGFEFVPSAVWVRERSLDAGGPYLDLSNAIEQTRRKFEMRAYTQPYADDETSARIIQASVLRLMHPVEAEIAARPAA